MGPSTDLWVTLETYFEYHLLWHIASCFSNMCECRLRFLYWNYKHQVSLASRKSWSIQFILWYLLFLSFLIIRIILHLDFVLRCSNYSSKVTVFCTICVYCIYRDLLTLKWKTKNELQSWISNNLKME